MPRRIRFIFGQTEESGPWDDMVAYVAMKSLFALASHRMRISPLSTVKRGFCAFI